MTLGLYLIHNLVSIVYLWVSLSLVNSQCTRPEDPPNGKIVEDGDIFQNGDRITYRCSRSYQTYTAIPSKRRCINDQWYPNYDEYTKNYCNLPSADPLPDILHGKPETDDTTAYKWVKYVCDKGYEYHGPPRGYICKRTRVWEPDPNESKTTCTIKDCGPKPTVEHAYVRMTDGTTTVGSRLEVIRNTGYMIDGSSTIECKDTGVWGDIPSCTVKDCGPKPTVRHATVKMTDGTTTYGSRLKVKCTAGYMIDGSSRFAKCEDTGWGDIPSCTAVKCPEPNILNGTYDGELTYPNSITYRCLTGFTLVGADQAECSANGTWNPKQQPKCNAELPRNRTKRTTSKEGIIIGVTVGIISVATFLVIATFLKKHKNQERIISKENEIKGNKLNIPFVESTVTVV